MYDPSNILGSGNKGQVSNCKVPLALAQVSRARCCKCKFRQPCISRPDPIIAAAAEVPSSPLNGKNLIPKRQTLIMEA